MILSNLGLQPPETKQQQFPNFNNESRAIIDLIAEGSELEDTIWYPRPLNHFFDPINHRGLTVGFLIGTESPKWALELNVANNYFPLTGQDFSFSDARKYFLQALTGQAEQERDKYWGLTFQTLGHVIHHIQDMAQPQHVRNEQHLFPRSAYEETTEAIFDNLPEDAPFPFLQTFDPVNFATARKFWVTDEEDGMGQGLAEFTNNNFVSAATNFRGAINNLQTDPEYPLPNGQDAQLRVKRIEDPDLLGSGQPLRGQMVFIETPVVDRYQDTVQTNPRASTYSIFDPDLTTYSPTFQAIYSLNRFNYDVAREFLLPRAVAYSAGLINYFFRGRIDLAADPNNSLLYVITNRGAEDVKGTFTLYYDDVNDERRPIPDAQWRTTDYLPDGVLPKNGGELRVPVFVPPTDPPPKIPGEYLLVFEGDIGDEHRPQTPANAIGGIAAKKISLGCQAPFITPAGRVSYTGAGWVLEPDLTVQYGNTDWIGAGCRRLSWLGPFGRYIHMRHISQLSNHVFSDGKIIATAPGPVIGAAVQTRVSPPADFLVVVVAEVSEFGRVTMDTVYSAPLENPMAWTWVGSFDSYSADEQDTLPYRTKYPAHYFFNASGTQAVSVKRTASAEVSSVSGQNPWRLVTLDVTAGIGASFTLASVESLDTTGSDTTLRFTAHTIAADYQGDSLIRLHLDVEEHYAQSSTREDQGLFQSRTTETMESTQVWTLQTSTDWDWKIIDVSRSSLDIMQVTGYELIGYQLNESHAAETIRGVEYLDLRFAPPIVAYEEAKTSFDAVFEGGQDAMYVWHTTQDFEAVEQTEKLAWRVADTVHIVTGPVDIPPDGARLFTLPRPLDRLQSWGPNIEDVVPDGEEIGTFAVGGISAALQIVGAHKNPRIERNFMYPPGDLGIFGGGPVGR
jgi:hypothetical protein